MGLVESVRMHVDRARCQQTGYAEMAVVRSGPQFEAEDLLALMAHREFKGHDAGVELGRAEGNAVGVATERKLRDALLEGLVVEMRSAVQGHVRALASPLEGKDRRKKVEIVEAGVQALETVLAQLTALSVAAASGAFDVER